MGEARIMSMTCRLKAALPPRLCFAMVSLFNAASFRLGASSGDELPRRLEAGSSDCRSLIPGEVVCFGRAVLLNVESGKGFTGISENCLPYPPPW